MNRVYVNGLLVDARRASVPALDRGFLQGLGAFETLRCYDGEPFLLKEHVARLRGTARLLKIPCPIDKDLGPALRRLAAANGLRDAVLRVMVTAGDPALGLRPSLIATADPLPPWKPEWFAEGVRVVAAASRRGPALPLAGLKSLHYLDHRLERERARRRGAFEAVYLSPNGDVLEGTCTNVFAVFGARVVTPPRRAGILPGITRARVMKRLGAREANLPLARFLRADEAFLTNSLIEAMPIRSWENRRIGSGRFPVTARVRSIYR